MSEYAQQPTLLDKLFFWRKPKGPKENRWEKYCVTLRPSASGATYITITDKQTGERIADDHYTSSRLAFSVKWDVQDLIIQYEGRDGKARKKAKRSDKQKAKLREAGFDVHE